MQNQSFKKWQKEYVKILCIYNVTKSVINIAYNHMQHDNIKRIEIDRIFMKEKLDSSLICTLYIPNNFQIANVLTKDVRIQHSKPFIGKIGMNIIYSPQLDGSVKEKVN